MNLTPEYLSEIFREISERDFCFNEALSIVRQNCQGRIWLIGGFLYKNLASIIYQDKIAKLKDIDFLVENRERYENLALPEGYEASHSRFAGIKIEGRLKIDVIEIEHFWPAAINFVEPTIENFLFYAPLNIQSIAYDVFEKRIIGDIGIKAIEKRAIKVNNENSADFCSRIMGKTTIEMMLEKAKELQFKAEFA